MRTRLKEKFDPTILGIIVAVSLILSLIGYLEPRIRLAALLLYVLIIGLLAIYISRVE